MSHRYCKPLAGLTPRAHNGIYLTVMPTICISSQPEAKAGRTTLGDTGSAFQIYRSPPVAPFRPHSVPSRVSQRRILQRCARDRLPEQTVRARYSHQDARPNKRLRADPSFDPEAKCTITTLPLADNTAEAL